MNFIRWIAGFLIAFAMTGFAVMNTHTTPVTFSPFHPPRELPLYLTGVALAGAGFLTGALSVWLNFSGLRETRRRQKRHIKTLERALDAANENAAATPALRSHLPFLPRLTKK